jgi:hypothetical protein
MNKDLLMSFLNALLDDSKKEITEVEYLNGENLGEGYGDRRSIFDVYCKTKDGSRFIVEMQKAEQSYFKDRSVYYATTPIRQQAPKGKWDYHLENVYTVGILNFEFPNNEYPANSYRHEIKLKDVEDMTFKVKNGKHLKKYPSVEKMVKPLANREDVILRKEYNKYTRDAYLYQREKELYKGKGRIDNEFLHIPAYLPKSLDLNEVAKELAKYQTKKENK